MSAITFLQPYFPENNKSVWDWHLGLKRGMHAALHPHACSRFWQIRRKPELCFLDIVKEKILNQQTSKLLCLWLSETWVCELSGVITAVMAQDDSCGFCGNKGSKWSVLKNYNHFSELYFKKGTGSPDIEVLTVLVPRAIVEWLVWDKISKGLKAVQEKHHFGNGPFHR